MTNQTTSLRSDLAHLAQDHNSLVSARDSQADTLGDLLRVVERIATALNRSPDTESAVEAAVAELARGVDALRSAVVLTDHPEPRRWSEYASKTLSPDELYHLRELDLRLAESPTCLSDGVVEFNVNPPETRSRLNPALMPGPFLARGSLVAPIIIDSAASGALIVYGPSGGWPSPEVRTIVQIVASSISMAVSNDRLNVRAVGSNSREALSHRLLTAILLNQIVAAIRRSLDLKETLQVAVEELGRALGADRVSFRRAPDGKIFVARENGFDSALSMFEVSPASADYVVHYLSQMRRSLIIDDVRSFIAAHPEITVSTASLRSGAANRSEIISPIFVNDEFWGWLSIGHSDRVRKWSASEIALIEAVTAQIEVAVSHSHLLEETRRVARTEALISHIVHGINQSNSLGEILPVVARELGEHLAAESVMIAKLDSRSGNWIAECEFSGGRVRRPQNAETIEYLRELEPLMRESVLRIDDVVGDSSLSRSIETHLRAAGTRALMAVRINGDDGFSLAVAALMRTSARIWNNEEVEVMRATVDQVFTAIQRADLFDRVSRGKVEWEATFDALADGIFIFDQAGILRRVNQAGAAFEGNNVADLIGRQCCTLMQGIEGEGCRVAPVIKTGRPVTFELMPERLSRPVLVTISPLTVAPRGYEAAPGDRNIHAAPAGHNGSLGAVCIVRDLSELRAAEAAAREQRSFLIKLLEHANDAIFALSPEGRFVWFNEQLVALSGHSREELTSNDYRRFIPPEDKKSAVERFTRALAGKPQTFEMRGVRKDGEIRMLLVTYTPIYDQGRVTSVLSIARDVTEEKLASERAAQADKLRALGQLASGVAHNFNNVLAAILGHAQLLKRDCRDDTAVQRLDIVERAALDGAETVKRIQGFCLQQDTSVYGPVDLNQLIQDSTNLTRARWQNDAQALGLRYDVDLELNAVHPVLGSPSELREVFVNIILNALDAMPRGGRLRIITETKGSAVRAHFADSGVGMSREVCDHIFEPFFTTKGTTGMGLGLAVSYSIVERHGGRIEASSDPGRGSTFSVTLPVSAATLNTAAPGNRLQIEPVRVLVIDDDQRVREAVAGMLCSAGHRIEEARSGPEALRLMQDERFKLVLTDLSMPDMDGWAVSAKIRNRWPDVKIILMTGYAVPPDTIHDNRELVDQIIYKPIRFEEISSALNTVLRP